MGYSAPYGAQDGRGLCSGQEQRYAAFPPAPPSCTCVVRVVPSLYACVREGGLAGRAAGLFTVPTSPRTSGRPRPGR